MASIAALLLAAGESTRMGDLKALLTWGDTSLLEHQVAALASAGVTQTIVVLGYGSDRLESLLKDRAGIRCVYNADYRQGKATSVRAGVRALMSGQQGPRGGTYDDAILVLNVDQPRSSCTIRRIIELHSPRGTKVPPERACLITIPTYRGKGGHPIILSSALIPELIDISEDTLGLKAVVRRHEEETRRVEMDSPEVLLDLNTPEEYDQALKTFTPG